MLDISKLISISESAGAAVQIQEPAIECPEEYKNLSMSESSLYFENQMLKCELEYRDIMDESVNTMIQDMLDRQNGIVNEATLIDRAKQIAQRVWETIKRIAKAIAKFFSNIAKKFKELFAKGRGVNEKAAKAMDDVNKRFNSKDKKSQNESAADEYHKNHEERMKDFNKKMSDIGDSIKKDKEDSDKKQKDTSDRLKALLGESMINENFDIDVKDLVDSHPLIKDVEIDDNSIRVYLKESKYTYVSADHLDNISKSLYEMLDEFMNLDKLIRKYSDEQEIIKSCENMIIGRLADVFNVKSNEHVDLKTLCNSIKRYELDDYDSTSTFCSVALTAGRTNFNDIIDKMDSVYGDGWHYEYGITFAKYSEKYDKDKETFNSKYIKQIQDTERRLYEIINLDRDTNKYQAKAMRFYVVIPECYQLISNAVYSIFYGELAYYTNMTTLAAKLSNIYCKVLSSEV